jgi:pimeloyl-ACP methyl ester carboxylesterase
MNRALLLIPALLCAVVARAQTPPVRNAVRTDDGLSLVVWSKKPATTPRGEIVLLHGRTWSALPNFDLQVPGRSESLMDALVAQGYAVYAVDQRGYGATQRDATGWLTPDRAARDAGNVVDWVAAQAPNHRRPALFGYSRGSMTAEIAAQRRPASIAALILYGFPYDVKTPPVAVKDPAQPPREKTTAKAAGEDFLTPDSLAAGVKEAYVAAGVRLDPVRVDWRREVQSAEINPKLLRTPTLFINGELDPYAKAADIPAFLVQVQAADREWVVLSHGDHVVHLERPVAFARAVGNFLDREMRR